jgi:hypothetical protein
MSELDFLLGDGGSDAGTATATAVAPVNEAATGVVGADGKPPPTGNAARVLNRLAQSQSRPAAGAQSDSDEAARNVLEEIADILVPPPEDEPTARDEKGRFAKAGGEAADAESDVDTQTVTPTAKQPIHHDPRLIYAASANGIGPDEAAQYPTGRALLAEINLRRQERGVVDTPAGEQKGKAKTAEDEFAPPTLEFDEDIDPKLKASIEKTLGYTQKIIERDAKEKAALREEIEQLKSEHEHAARRDTRQTEAKIAQMFDEKVASWGEEYAELLGVPTESYKTPGTKQHTETKKLREYVLRQKAGYEALTGQEATMDDVGNWLDEARYALWRDAAERGARNKVAKGLAKQRGGVGLRSGRSSRETEPPVQGDEAAKAALLSEHPELFYSWTGKRRSA